MIMEKEKSTKTAYGLIKPSKIEDEMKTAYLDYAMSVIVARALPDVRDGLKPVHRRILYSMHQLGLGSKAKYRKSAAVVGDVLAKYHPHGDIAVYDSLVRMAQDFAMRYPLINGQGNFGSIDGDSAAAMRYTETRMTKISEELLSDIEKETISFMDNYDGTTKEPVVLPAKLPNLLLNGTMGIAVGMATNIPPHNAGEVLDALIYLIEKPETKIDDLFNFIKGPDFPTGGIIYDFKQIKEAYTTGRGKIVMRGVAEVVEAKKQGGRQQIIISEIPYGVNKADLVSKIALLAKNRKIDGVADLRDESDRNGIRVVLDLKRDAFPQKILNALFKFTQLQETFHLNMLALIDGLVPRVLTLKMVLEEWLKHRREVVKKRCEFELRVARAREHILKGLKLALDNLDEVIKTIKASKTREEAQNNLIKKFKLDKIQANAILEIRLQTLAALERQKILDELDEKLKIIAYLEDVLAHPEKILKIIKEELLQLKHLYQDKRRTKVIRGEVGTFADSDLIPNEEVIVTITASNYVKRTPIAIYRSQGRGGKGVLGMETKEKDDVLNICCTYNLNNILFFTNRGRVFQTKVYDIPQSSRISKGLAIVNLIPLVPQEKVTGIITMKEDESGFLLMATMRGIVKKTALSSYKTVRKSGLVAIKLDSQDELCWVSVTKGNDEILLATKNGLAIRFKETDVKVQARATRGVMGIRIKGDDQLIGMDIVRKDANLLIVSSKGLGKKTPIRLYKTQKRGGLGIMTQRVNDKTGKVVAVHMLDDKTKDIILVSKSGQMIRMPYRRISTLGRATQGVRLMRMKAEDKVASVAFILKDENDNAEEKKSTKKRAKRSRKPKKITKKRAKRSSMKSKLKLRKKKLKKPKKKIPPKIPKVRIKTYKPIE